MKSYMCSLGPAFLALAVGCSDGRIKNHFGHDPEEPVPPGGDDDTAWTDETDGGAGTQDSGGADGGATGDDSSTGDPAGTGDTSTGSVGTTGDGSTGTPGTTTTDGTPGVTTGTGTPPDLLDSPNLWYAVNNRLFYIPIDAATGMPTAVVESSLEPAPQGGQNGITMLDDGSLLLSREGASGTVVYHVPSPSTVAGGISAVATLGTIPGLRIEGLYTDCEGLVYLMDTGTDTTDPDGNRLLRFTGNFLMNDLSFEVITDLAMASVADIDDMSPGISANDEITDGFGYAIDSGEIYEFDYNTGTGSHVATGGTFGVHALGGPLFDDDSPRLYVFDSSARLFMADPATYNLSGVLIQGPPTLFGQPGHSGLAGPLTECNTTFPPPQ